jgi:hypothetical protein
MGETFRVTHPFHPLYGREYKLITYCHGWEAIASIFTTTPAFDSVNCMGCRRMILSLFGV